LIIDQPHCTHEGRSNFFARMLSIHHKECGVCPDQWRLGRGFLTSTHAQAQTPQKRKAEWMSFTLPTLPLTAREPGLPLETTPNLAEINGARIWYAERGQKAPGVPVLPLHGGFGNSNYFGNLIPSLVAKGYRVIAMDSRGHGRSARTDAPQTYHQMAEDVAINHPSRLGGVD
jgi:predicted alpha/beta-fold hydrolase